MLDPACGTGNFLYVALEMMKQLEGDVLQTLTDLGELQASLAMAGETVDPHQFLGLELNPRAAAIAELVIWIGYLQWHYRNHESHPAEPILRAFSNINFGRREGYDAVLTWDGYPLTSVVVDRGTRVETHPNPRRPAWPEAEFIVGNPPFMGGKDLRSRMDPGYAEALWKAHSHMNESADFVMYWWDRAAEILARKKSSTRRFGFVTTNSISQVFQRRVMERHLNSKTPISLLYAVADHPWTKATRDTAAVRIAMTAVAPGLHEGRLLDVAAEEGLETDNPRLNFRESIGRINSDLTVGADVSRCAELQANRGLASRGVVLHGAGFILSPEQAHLLGLGRRESIERHIRPYRNGRDLTQRARGVMAIDLFGLDQESIRRQFPEVYQHILERVKPERDLNPRPYRRDNWWLFGENVPEARKSWVGLDRYIATVETAKYRIFQFLDAEILPDNKLIVVSLRDPVALGVLSSRIHTHWATAAGGWLGYGNDPVYVKTSCFDPFPFPELGSHLRSRLGLVAEELDATRKLVLADHSDLTLTGLYNLIEKLKAAAELTPTEEDAKQRGRVLILKELHEQIDLLTAEAYGWPSELSDEEILVRLVALNAERAKEEAAGQVRWLRPEYQTPRFSKGATAKTGELDLGETVVAIDKGLPNFPTDRYEQPLAIEAVLASAGRPMDATELSRCFKRGGKRIEQRVIQVLNTLTRYGRVVALPNGSFAARKAA